MRSTRPRKQFAQHWLKSEKALDKIVKAASLDGDRVLEIGPGTGILTRRLLPAAESVVAVEIDRDLCLKLAKQLGKTDNFLRRYVVGMGSIRPLLKTARRSLIVSASSWSWVT